MRIVYTAISKKNFFQRMYISKYVLGKGYIPINPFMNWDYFLADLVDRNVIRKANNELVKKCNELWVFGEVSDGVQKELDLAKRFRKKIKYFDIINLPNRIDEISKENIVYEK